MKNIQFVNIASRLGLKNFPLGMSDKNRGVEEGGRALLESFNTTAFHTAHFPKPEELSAEGYLEKTLQYYQDLSSKLVAKLDASKSTVFLGGDHSISFASLTTVLEIYGNKDTCMVMFDSHADCHQPTTSPSGNFHGMWLRPFFEPLTGYDTSNAKINPSQYRHVGNQDFEQEEHEYFSKHNVLCYTENQINNTAAQELAQWSQNYKHLHVTFDLDIFHKSLVCATGIPAENGLDEKAVFTMLKPLAKHPSISLDIVEYNPEKDKGDESLRLCRKVIGSLGLN